MNPYREPTVSSWWASLPSFTTDGVGLELSDMGDEAGFLVIAEKFGAGVQVIVGGQLFDLRVWLHKV